MSKAAFITERPPLDQLELKMSLDTPSTLRSGANSDIQQNEILVQVKSSSVNIDDIHLAEGSFLGGVPGLQTKPPSTEKPVILGSDFAGVIVKMGDKVDKDKFKIGQRVCGMNHQQSLAGGEQGTWAEYTVSIPKNIVILPDHVSFPDAAASVLPLFVISGLLDVAKLKGDERVVVIGASGGIGSTLVKVLRTIHPKLYITGVCSSRNEGFVKGLGANGVVDYTKGPIENTLKAGGYEKFNVVFDLVGGKASHESARAILGKGGRFITAVGPIQWIGDEMLSTIALLSFFFGVFWQGLFNFLPGSHCYYHLVVPSELNGEIFELVFSHGISSYIEKSFPFHQDGLKEAFQLVRSHRAKGKIMLQM